MAMTQIGFVIEVSEESIKVRVDRESACGGNCAVCHGCPQNAVVVTCPVQPDMTFRQGEKVRVLMPTGRFFSGMMRSYGVLIFTVLLGAVLGFFLTKSEGVSVLGAFIGLLIGGFLVSLFSKKFPSEVIVEKIDR